MLRINKAHIIILIIVIMQATTIAFALPPIPANIEVDGDYPPYEYMKGNELYGFDLDLQRQIFIDNTYDITYSSDTWNKTYERIKKGEIDSCGLLAIKEERKKDIIYTQPVALAHIALYTKKSMSNVNLTNFKDFRVAVQKDDFAEIILKKDYPAVNYFTFDSYSDAIKALEGGNIDIIFGNQEVINYCLIEHGLGGKIVPQLTNLYPIEFAFGIKKSNTELASFMDRRIAALIKSGIYEEIYQKYFFKHSDKYYKVIATRIIVIVLLITVIILVLAKLGHTYVRYLKAKLSSANEETAMQYHWMRATLSGIGDAVITLDNDGNIIYMNRSAEVLRDYTKAQRLYENAFASLHKTSGKSTAFVETTDNNLKLEVDSEKNTILIAQNGEENWFYYYTFPVEDDDGINMGYALILHDISVRRQASYLKEKVDENIRLLNMTMESDKIKTEFFTNISHELRTPINVILATQQLLELYQNEGKAEGLKYNLSKYIGIIRQNCYRLLKLVNNLVDITKINAGYYDISLSNHNIVSLVEDIVESVAQYVENKSIHLVFDTDIEEKIMACDAEKIERILLNLMSNAVKFTEEGGNITVCITDLNDRVRISVQDTGIGIPKDMLNIIFERFMQVQGRGAAGSGIGLALTRSLVEMHKGTIYAKSEEGIGSEFIIELPAEQLIEADTLEPDEKFAKSNVEKFNVEFSDS